MTKLIHRLPRKGSIVGTIQSKSLDCQYISERPRPWPSTIGLEIGRRKLFFPRRLTRTKPKPFRPHIGVSRSLLEDAPNYHRTNASWNRMRDFPVLQRLDRHTRNLSVRRRSPGTTHHLPGLGAGTRSRRDPRTGRGFLAGTPHTAELVIEIFVTSQNYDRSNLRAYANAGVKQCWLVLAPGKQIEAHRNPDVDRFTDRTVHGPGGRLTCAAVPEITLDLDALFAK